MARGGGVAAGGSSEGKGNATDSDRGRAGNSPASRLTMVIMASGLVVAVGLGYNEFAEVRHAFPETCFNVLEMWRLCAEYISWSTLDPSVRLEFRVADRRFFPNFGLWTWEHSHYTSVICLWCWRMSSMRLGGGSCVCDRMANSSSGTCGKPGW